MQGNGTPDRQVCNGGSSPGNSVSQHEPGTTTNHRPQTSCGVYCYGNRQSHVNQQQNPTASHQQQQLSNQVEPTHNSSSYNDTTQYLPGHQFNSGQSSPHVSGQSSPHQLNMDQESAAEAENENEQSVLKSAEVWQKEQKQLSDRDELRLNLPYTLSTSLATTSDTVIPPAGSHHPQLPPQINHREERTAAAAAGGADIWSGDDSHHPLSCGESTGGDSGMIEDVDWDTQDTSPDFVQKALMAVSADTPLYVV